MTQGIDWTETGRATGAKSILIEGWRGVNHSFALVNQYQVLELLRFSGLTLFHNDLPFAYPHWTRSRNASGLSMEDQALVDALVPPAETEVDCVYRICAPFRAGARNDRRKTATFMITELGLSPSSFADVENDSDYFTRDDNFIVTGSHWARERLVDWGYAPEKIEVIAHGVDAGAFQPLTGAERQSRREALGLRDDEIVFLNIGLPTWNKGLDLLLLAFARLKTAGHKIRLILKDQTDLYGRSVQTLIRELAGDHPELVTSETLGAISVISTNIERSDIRVLYGVADCYVSPYRAEGFNLPVLEAIACGTPVIVTRGGATDDFCNDDVALRISGTPGSRVQDEAGFIGQFIEPSFTDLLEAMESFSHGRPRDLQGFDAARALLTRRFTWRNAALRLAQVTAGYRPADGMGDRGPEAGPAQAIRRGSTEVLIDVARGAAACQSTQSIWSRPGEAANAVSGPVSDDFSFHTEKEDGPWWQVDLGASYPIEKITIHNRVSGFHDRARTLKIELATVHGAWTVVHSGISDFGARQNGRPLDVSLGSAIDARYIRLSLDEHNYLHLSQVEVFARIDLLAFGSFCRSNHLFNLQRNSTDFGRPYSIERRFMIDDPSICGLKINYSSRFGNLMQQYTHAIQLALKCGLKYVQLGHNELFDLKQPVSIGTLTLLPETADVPTDGLFLTGSYFNSDPFYPVLSPFLRFSPEDEAAYSHIAQAYLRPHVLTGIPLHGERHPSDELTIHIRSGDLFVGDQTGNSWYRQPPLSFYTLVIDRMRGRGAINRVRLVYEDRENPCIDRLEAWMVTREIPFRCQCGSLRDDMSALIDAPHLVFGYGTFGYGACRLSRHIETLHFFAPELGGSYAHIQTIRNVFRVSDQAGHYIKAGNRGIAGEWTNSVEQRDLMLAYPAQALHIEALSASQADDVRACRELELSAA